MTALTALLQVRGRRARLGVGRRSDQFVTLGTQLPVVHAGPDHQEAVRPWLLATRSSPTTAAPLLALPRLLPPRTRPTCRGLVAAATLRDHGLRHRVGWVADTVMYAGSSSSSTRAAANIRPRPSRAISSRPRPGPRVRPRQRVP